MNASEPTSHATRGIHHITAIASDPARNVEFYTRVLGLRLIKKTVNFDDPGTYHLYYGDDPGSPGTIMTFFPWPHVKRGDHGAGFLNATAFAVAQHSLEFWRNRLAALPREVGVVVGSITTRFGTRVLPFEDHDAMRLELIEDAGADPARAATITTKTANPLADTLAAGSLPPVPIQHAIRGFHSATIVSRSLDGTARFLSELLGMRRVASETSNAGGLTRHRFSTIHTDVATARHVDIVVNENVAIGKLGGGIVHHIAFRASDELQQMAWHAKLVAQSRNVSPQMDRNYFKSIYFREPGGVLFEVATDAPGFAIDEPLESLGESLKLPAMYEHRRGVIESFLPRL